MTSGDTIRAKGVGGCRIKGNVSYNRGMRIYHMPGDRDYSRTRIDSSRGERWFCTEAEARAAGWSGLAGDILRRPSPQGRPDSARTAMQKHLH